MNKNYVLCSIYKKTEFSSDVDPCDKIIPKYYELGFVGEITPNSYELTRAAYIGWVWKVSNPQGVGKKGGNSANIIYERLRNPRCRKLGIHPKEIHPDNRVWLFKDPNITKHAEDGIYFLNKDEFNKVKKWVLNNEITKIH